MLNDFYNNFFGSIAGGIPLQGVPSFVDFVPAGSKGETINIKGDSAVWLGMRSRIMQKYAYEFCFPVSAVTDKLAELDLTGCVEILKTYGKSEDNYANNEWAVRMSALLAQPNPLQSWEQFRGQQVMYKKVFGFCPVLPIIPAGFESQPYFAKALYNLPPWHFKVYPKKRALYATTIEELVEKYTVSLCGYTYDIKPSQIFILEDSFMQDEEQDFLLPKSRLCGLDMAISNICAAMEADNVLLRKKGPLGFISHDAGIKDGITGYLPMRKSEKMELQSELTAYGLSFKQFQYVISRVAAKWNPTSYNVKELGTKETVVAGEKAICIRMDYKYVLYEQTSTTYANGENATSDLYTSNVIPNNRKDFNKYNIFFKGAEQRAKIVGNFDDVPALQEDMVNKNTASKALTERLKIEYDSNLITLNQWRSAMGYDTIPGDGDKYKNELSNKSELDNPLDKDILEDEDIAPEA